MALVRQSISLSGLITSLLGPLLAVGASIAGGIASGQAPRPGELAVTTTPVAGLPQGQFRSPVDSAKTEAARGPAVELTQPTSAAEKRMALPKAGSERPLPLHPRSKTSAGNKISGASPLLAGLGSLAVVLGLFFVVAWALRRSNPQSAVLLPGEVVELLGRSPLPGRQQMHLIRCGNKLLLVCLSATGMETLTEITDTAEVERLASLCRQAHPSSATATFQHVLDQLSRQPAPKGFLGDPASEDRLLADGPRHPRGRQENVHV